MIQQILLATVAFLVGSLCTVVVLVLWKLRPEKEVPMSRNATQFLQSVMIEGCQTKLFPITGDPQDITAEVQALAALGEWAANNLEPAVLPESFRQVFACRMVSDT